MPDNQPSKELEKQKGRDLSLKERVEKIASRKYGTDWKEEIKLIEDLWEEVQVEGVIQGAYDELLDQKNALQEQLTATQQALDSAVEALEYIEFSAHFRCDTYNGRSCDVNTQEAYESSLKAIGDAAKAALASIKEEL